VLDEQLRQALGQARLNQLLDDGAAGGSSATAGVGVAGVLAAPRPAARGRGRSGMASRSTGRLKGV
jgi:hypothetical protein